MQFIVEEAAATALELHEANLAAAAHTAAKNPGGESAVRSRHQQLIDQAAS